MDGEGELGGGRELFLREFDFWDEVRGLVGVMVFGRFFSFFLFLSYSPSPLLLLFSLTKKKKQTT